MKKISEKLQILRKSAGYTQREMSNVMNCGYSTIGHYESGRVSPTIKVIEELCKKFPEYTLWLITNKVDIKQIESNMRGEL